MIEGHSSASKSPWPDYVIPWAKKYPLEARVFNFRLPTSDCARLSLFDTDWVGLRSLLTWMRKWFEFCVNTFFWIWGIFAIFTVKIQTVDWVSKQQEREVRRLQQSWFKTTCIVFYNNISAGHTSLLQVYRCYWTYVAITILYRWRMSQQLERAVGHRVVVKSFSGSKAMKDYLKPNSELSQVQVILHVGTNDLEQ